MCDISSLLAFEVFGTENTEESSFLLYRSCEQVERPFNQYCLIPPISRMTTSCNSLDDFKSPESLFQRAITGKIQSLRQLPNIFESWQSTSSQEPYIFLNVQVKDYQRKVEKVQAFAVFNQTCICIAPGPQQNSYQLLMLDNAGIFRSQRTTTNNAIIQTEISNTRYGVYMNTDASKRYAILNGTLYLQRNDGRWTIIVENNACNVLMHTNTTILVTKKQVIFVEPLLNSLVKDFEQDIIWSCLTKDSMHAVLGCFVNATTTKIEILEIMSGEIVQSFIAPGFNLNTSTLFSACMSDIVFDGQTPLSLVLTDGGVNGVQHISMFPQTSTTSVAYSQNRILEFQSQFFINTEGRIQNIRNSQVYSPSPMVLSQGTTEIFANFQGESVYILSSTGLLCELSTTNDSWKQQTKEPLYFQYGALIEDEIEADAQILSTNMFVPWYNGQSSFTIAPTLTPSAFIGASRHNRYRYVVADISTPTDFTFPLMTTRVERTNEFLFLMSPELYEVKLYDDANIMVVANERNKRVVWSSNTHDKSNDSTSFKVWPSRQHALVTTNGLYVLYFDASKQTVKLAYNIFNNPRFTIFCKQSAEYVVRALDAQSDFCFKNLRVDDQKDSKTVVEFADSRCACIGGQQLLENVFPAFAQKHSQTTGRLIANLPCLLSQCGASFLHGPELTNTYEHVSATCKGDLVVCSDIIEIGEDSNFDLNAFQLQQNCGKDPTACVKNEECPRGFICLDGRCVASCTSNIVCQEKLGSMLAVCDPNGRCVFPILPKVVTAISIWRIVVVVCVALIVLFVILLLAIFIKDKTKTPVVVIADGV